jgi:uncharacterized membrane protein YkvA (DUF1232 family)
MSKSYFFSSEEERKAIEMAFKLPKKQNLKNDVKKIERNLPGMKKGSIQEVWGKVQGLSKAVIDPRVAWQEKSIAVGALLYLVSPVDLIPDTIPVVGLIDDAGVISAAAKTLANVLSKYAVAATSSLNVTVGAVSGVNGVKNQRKANTIIEASKQEYDLAAKYLEIEWKRTQDLAQSYGELQIEVKTKTIPRYLALLDNISNNLSKRDSRFLKTLTGISIPTIPTYNAEVKTAQECIQAAGKGFALGGIYTSQIVIKRATGLFGNQAFKAIGNAVARKAIVTEIGAGSMTVGKLFLSGAAITPVLAGLGVAIGKTGEQALTTAMEYEKDIKIDIERMKSSQEELKRIQNNVNDLKGLVEKLNIGAISNIEPIESVLRVDHSLSHQEQMKLKLTGNLTKALVEIMDTSILDLEGNINPATAKITAKIKEEFDII